MGEGRSNQTLANPKSQWCMEEAGGVNSFLSSGSPKDGLPEVWSRRLATCFGSCSLVPAFKTVGLAKGGWRCIPSTPHFVPMATFWFFLVDRPCPGLTGVSDGWGEGNGVRYRRWVCWRRACREVGASGWRAPSQKGPLLLLWLLDCMMD